MPHRRGAAGRVPMEMELRIRFDYGSIVPWVRREAAASSRWPGPTPSACASPVPLQGQDLTTVASFEVPRASGSPSS